MRFPLRNRSFRVSLSDHTLPCAGDKRDKWGWCVCRGRGWGEGVVTIALSRRSHAALRWHPCQFPLQNLLYSSSFALPLCFFFHLKGPSRVIYKVSHKDLEYLMSPVRNVRNIPSCEGKGFVPRLQSLGFLEVQCTLAGLGHHTCTLEGRYDLT